MIIISFFSTFHDIYVIRINNKVTFIWSLTFLKKLILSNNKLQLKGDCKNYFWFPSKYIQI
jgi:hypothetical protein